MQWNFILTFGDRRIGQTFKSPGITGGLPHSITRNWTQKEKAICRRLFLFELTFLEPLSRGCGCNLLIWGLEKWPWFQTEGYVA